MDSFFAKTMQHGKELSFRDFQLVGIVALLVSSKMFCVGNQLRVVRSFILFCSRALEVSQRSDTERSLFEYPV
jgi:hypothetical protein